MDHDGSEHIQRHHDRLDTDLLPVVTEAGLPAELDNDPGQVLRHQPVLPDPAFPDDFGRGGDEFCFALTFSSGFR